MLTETLLSHVIYLACSTNLPTGLYTLLALVSFCNSSQIISGFTGLIFAFFSPNLCEFYWSGPFFRFLKWRCHGNRFWAKLAKWPVFNMLAFWISQFRFTGIKWQYFC